MTPTELKAKWAEFLSEAGEDLPFAASTSRVLEKKEGRWKVHLGHFNSLPEANQARDRYGQALAEKFGDEVEFVFVPWFLLED